MNEFVTKYWEGIIAGIALLTSFLGVWIAYRTFKIQREYNRTSLQIQRTHNYKSLKPLGSIRIGDYQDNIFIKIDNNGTGPMIIQQIETCNSLECITSKLIDILPNDLASRISWTNFTGGYEDRSILPGENLELLVWTINESYDGDNAQNIEQDRHDVRFALKDLTVKLTYTDIYESEQFKTELQLNEWYGRHFV